MSTRTIWKFTVPVADSQQIKIEGANLVEILDAKMSSDDIGVGSLGVNGDRLVDIWAVVDAHPGSIHFAPIEMRGTGHPLHEERLLGQDAEIAWIATVRDGIFVWHIFRGGVFDSPFSGVTGSETK